MIAPHGGNDQSQIRTFVQAIQRWDCDRNRNLPSVLLERGEFSQVTDKTFIVCYERANGTRHCASKEGERFLCCQLKDTGIDVIQEVRT
jgi:hypothetical protein